MPREDEAAVRSEGRKTRPRANSDNKNEQPVAKNNKQTSSNAGNSDARDNSATVRNVSSVGNSSANSSNSSKWSSNVASSRNAIAIVTGSPSNSSAPNAIVRTRSDGRATSTSDSECSSSRGV